MAAQGEPWSARVGKGDRLRLIDLEGQQAIDFLCYNADDPAEVPAVDQKVVAATGRGDHQRSSGWVHGLGRAALDQRDLIKLVKRGDYRQSSHKLRNKAVLDQILWFDPTQQFTNMLRIVLAAHFCAEADATLLGTLLYHFVEAVKCTTANEQYVGRINLHKFLIWMFAPSLRRY